jgi:hypothetical protein
LAFSQHVSIDLIESGILLRNAAGIDNPAHWHAVLDHALQNNARMERSPFDRGERLILRFMGGAQPSVTPLNSGFTSTVRSPLSQAIRRSPVWPARYLSRSRESSATVPPAPRAMASNMSPVADKPASMPVRTGMNRSGHHAADAGNQLRPPADGHDAGGSGHHVHHSAQPHAGANRIPASVRLSRPPESECRRKALAFSPRPASDAPRSYRKSRSGRPASRALR